MSKFVAFPMLSLGVVFGNLERRNKPFSYVVDVVILLAGWFLFEKKFKVPKYEMVLYGTSFVLMMGTGTNYVDSRIKSCVVLFKAFNLYILIATGLYVVGGLVMGGSFTAGPLGIYKVNWFHYLLAIANIMYGEALVTLNHV
jgi:hypothetical protein